MWDDVKICEIYSWSFGNGDVGRGGSMESDYFVVVEW